MKIGCQQALNSGLLCSGCIPQILETHSWFTKLLSTNEGEFHKVKPQKAPPKVSQHYPDTLQSCCQGLVTVLRLFSVRLTVAVADCPRSL